MSATYANVTNQIAALKELYAGGDYMKDLVYKKNPFLALVPKDESPEGFAGKYIPVPVIYGSNQGRSATFAQAQTNQTPAALASFFVYRVSNYSIASITNELLEATAGNAGAFLDEGKLQVDMAIRSLVNDIAADLYRSGTGTRGVISTYSLASTTVTLTLTNAADVSQFEVGMLLHASATDGGVPSAQTMLVTKVDRVSGTLIGTGSNGTMGSEWAVGAYLSMDGDVAAAGSTATSTYMKMTGLGAWLPTSVASGDSFWGVNRSVDARLSGLPWDGSSQSIEEAVIDASAQVAREGGEPDYLFTNFSTWAALEKELGSKVQYVQVKHEEADIAFKGLTVNAPYGPVQVIADRNCPAKKGFLVELSTFKLRSLGKAPHILTYGKEGLEGIRVGSADALEVRVGLYGNLICNAPAWNSQITFSA
jgi:hypothetical protein